MAFFYKKLERLSVTCFDQTVLDQRVIHIIFTQHELQFFLKLLRFKTSNESDSSLVLDFLT